jgi:hypothetical protein
MPACAGLALAACGAFSGQDESAAVVGGDAAAADDASDASADGTTGPSGADGAARDGGEAGDETDASQPDGDASTCALVFSDGFEDNTFATNWSLQSNTGTNPFLSTVQAVGMSGHSLYAHIDTTDTSTYFVYASRGTKSMIAPTMIVTYSVYLPGWSNFSYVDVGCSLELDVTGTSASYIDLEAEQTGGFNLVATVANQDNPQALTGNITAAGWYDVVLVTTGVGTDAGMGGLTTHITIYAHGTTTALVTGMKTFDAPPPVTAFVVNCGLAQVESLDNGPTAYDVWIDNVTLTACH